MVAPLMVQPGVTAGLLADPMAEDTGLLARFLICDPDSAMGERFSYLVRGGQDAIGRFNDQLREICETLELMNPDMGRWKCGRCTCRRKHMDSLVATYSIQAQMAWRVYWRVGLTGHHFSQ